MDPSDAYYQGYEHDSRQNVWPPFDEYQNLDTSRLSSYAHIHGPSPSMREQSSYVTDNLPDECSPPYNLSNPFPISTDDPGSASTSEHFWQDPNSDSRNSVMGRTPSFNYQPASTVVYGSPPRDENEHRRRYTRPESQQQQPHTYRYPHPNKAVQACKAGQVSKHTQSPGDGTFDYLISNQPVPVPSPNPQFHVPTRPKPLLPTPTSPAATTAPAPTPPNLFAHLQLSLFTPPLTSHPAPEPQKPTTRYQPHWTRSRGAQKEGWCGYCHPGRWLNLKRSTYCYHLRNHHGIGVDGAVLAGPVGWRVKSKGLGGGSGGGGGGGGGSHGGCGGGGGGGGGGEGRKGGAEWEAYCGECARWIGGNVRYRMEVSWFRHFAKVGSLGMRLGARSEGGIC